MMKSNEELVSLIKAGTDQKQNLEILFSQNSPIVKKIALRYTNRAEFDDLYQECFLALAEAVKRYNADYRNGFLSFFCNMMKWHLSRYINSTSRNIRIPAEIYSLILKYRSLKSSSSIGSQLTREQICKCLEISSEKLDEVIKAEQLITIVSLDTPAYHSEENSEITLMDTIAADSCQIDEADDKIFAEQRKAELWAVVDSLSGSLAEVIHQRFEEGLTLEEIAKQQGRTVERIRQKEKNAVRKLRQPKYANRLRPFLDDEYYSQGIKAAGPGYFQRTNTSSTERAALKIMEMEKALIRKKREGTLRPEDMDHYHLEEKKLRGF